MTYRYLHAEVQRTLSSQIGAIIGTDDPDLERLCVRILRGHRTKFDHAAALELLKSGMKAGDVLDGGLDVTWALSQQFGLDAYGASHLMATTVNTFAVSPQFFGLVRTHIASVRRALEGSS